MPEQASWGWFKNDPIGICENEVVADACRRGATVRVISSDGTRALVEYRGERDFVPSTDLLERPAPEFSWGDEVVIASKGTMARIIDVCWHFNRQRYYYYLEDNQGKAIKKRYFGDELERKDETSVAQEVESAIAELSEEFEDFNWWVQDDMSFLWDELEQELPAGHPLEGRDLAPMARCERNDDVLFHDGKGFLIVHLTWSKTNVLPFPLFEEVGDDDIAGFLRNDHLENVELEALEDDFCPVCGAELEGFTEGSCMGSLCPKCGWSVVATYMPPILEDERKYTITLLPGCTTAQEEIEAVSRVANCNFLAARQMLLGVPTELFTGLAPEVLERKRLLEEACVPIAVSPEFPYGANGELI